MKLSIREAFALEPVLPVEVGGRSYAVPPLTFGRLDELVKAQRATDLSSFVAGDFVAQIKDGSPESVGRALAHFPTEAFAPSAAAVIPGMTAAEWERNGTPFVFFELLKFFVDVHDWPYIYESMFSKSDVESSRASDVDLQTAILLMARELGCAIHEPLEFRAEGFFLSVEAIRGKRNAQEAAQERAEREAEGWDGPRPAAEVVPVVKNPAASANMDRLIAEAEARKAQESANG